MAPGRSTEEELRTARFQSAAIQPESGKREEANIARRSSSESVRSPAQHAVWGSVPPPTKSPVLMDGRRGRS